MRFSTSCDSRRPAMLDRAACGSSSTSRPARDKQALRALGEHLADRFSELGGAVERVGDGGGAFHVQARFSGPEERRPALLLAHFDTVWPLGTLERMPVREDEGRLFGPGVYDMKASLVMVAAVAGGPGPAETASCPGRLLVLLTLRRGDRQPLLAAVDRRTGQAERVCSGARASLGRRRSEDRRGRAWAGSRSRSRARPRTPALRPSKGAAPSSSWPTRSFADPGAQ